MGGPVFYSFFFYILLLVASNFHTPLKELAAVYYIIFLAIYLDCVSVDIRNRGREETDGEKGW
jgi:hypothetical protein